MAHEDWGGTKRRNRIMKIINKYRVITDTSLSLLCSCCSSVFRQDVKRLIFENRIEVKNITWGGKKITLYRENTNFKSEVSHV